jgi:hypothetical protein
VAYDPHLADRVRELLVDDSPLRTEHQLAQWIAIGAATATSAPATTL